MTNWPVARSVGPSDRRPSVEMGSQMRIENSIEIAAPVARVWRLTVDVESLPEVTPTITSVERLDDGPLRVGSSVRVKQPAQRVKTWTVTALEPSAYFAWAAKALGTTMTGGHRLTPTDTGTRNTLSIEIEGRLAPIIGTLVKAPLAKALETENEGFKSAAEA